MEQENFQEYMNYFKEQSLKDKQSIIIDQLKMLSSLTNTMCKQLKIENEIIINRELIDLNKDKYTEDDFAEAVIVYVNSIQNSICDFDLKLTEILTNITQ